MSIDAIKWMLVAVISMLGLPLGLLLGGLPLPKFIGVIVIVWLSVYLSYLIGAL